MSGLFPKPGDRSKIGIKGHVVQGTYALSRVAASAGSLDIGLADFAIMIDFNRFSTIAYSILIAKSSGIAGYIVNLQATVTTATILFQLISGAIVVTIGGLVYGRRHRLWFFADRDGNFYTYDNGILIDTTNIVAGNLNQDAVANYYVAYDVAGTPGYRSPDLLGIYHWNFGVGGLPDATTRAAIVAQDLSNPYLVPSLLSSRPNAATEERLRITCDNCDPIWTYVPDESPQVNHLTIGGGLTCASILKEFGSV